MSRGKKLTKAQKRLRRGRRGDEQAEAERRVSAKVSSLSCSHAAGDDLAALCGYSQETVGYDLDVAVAAERLWQRAGPKGHALTAALVDLQAELERHRDVMLALEQRFEVIMDATPHDHVEPQRRRPPAHPRRRLGLRRRCRAPASSASSLNPSRVTFRRNQVAIHIEALERGAISSASVAHVLDQRARAPKTPPPIPVVLPDDPRVRDLRVTPHALVDYDALAKETDDDDDLGR